MPTTGVAPPFGSHQPVTFGRDPSTYRFTIDQYQRMIASDTNSAAPHYLFGPPRAPSASARTAATSSAAGPWRPTAAASAARAAANAARAASVSPSRAS